MIKKEELFTKSEKFKEEYSCRVYKFPEDSIYDLPNSDFLSGTIISGEQIVVQRGAHKAGDCVLYVTKECVLNEDFLRLNNLYSDYTICSNAHEVAKLIAEAEQKASAGDEEGANALKSQARRMYGYFPDNGRLRITKLRGQVSSGFIFSEDALLKWKPELKEFFEKHSLSEFEGQFFDTIAGELFCKAYVPKIFVRRSGGSRKDRKRRRAELFNRVIAEHFSFHYDTSKLADNMWRFLPETKVVISNKLHGTSVIISNILCNNPMKIWLPKRIWNKIAGLLHLPKALRFKDSYVDYGNIYASRTVVKNSSIQDKPVNAGGYYSSDIWGEINSLVKDFIPKGMSVYGEIVGFLSTGSCIQKGYDYGCVAKKKKDDDVMSKVMFYRINTEDENGNKREWSVSEVLDWTKKLMEEHPDIAPRIHPIDIFYSGTLGDLYPELDRETHWRDNVLEALKNDVKHFGMEQNEPMCKNKVPREGIVIRIDEEPQQLAAWKLKTTAFALREAKEIDAGNVDIEMQDAYASGESSEEGTSEAESNNA